MKFKYIFLIIVLLNACTFKDKDYSQYKSGKVDIKFNYLKFEKIELEKIGSSFEGDLILMNDSILFVDKKFCWIYQFDLGGKLKKRCFGRGHGPNEIVKGIKKVTSINDTSIIILDRNNYFQFVSSELKTFKRLRLNIERNANFRNEKPPLDNPSYYSYIYNRTIIKEYKGFLYYNARMEHPLLNCIKHSDEFYENTRILAKVDLNSGRPIEILGEYSPYMKKHRVNQFNFSFFDITKEGNFIVGFACDTSLYQYSKDFEINKVFGVNGKEMNLEYRKLNSYNKYKKYCLEEEEEKGYFTGIKHFDDGILFRTYKKGKNQNDGLQIYRDQTLIADISVPKDFIVFGKNRSKYFAGVIDEESESILIYKFKINY